MIPMPYFNPETTWNRYSWKIEKSDECDFDWQLFANPIENLISHERKKWIVTAWNLQCVKTILTLELSQYSKSGSMFSSSKLVAVTACQQQLPLNLELCSGSAAGQMRCKGCICSEIPE